MSELGDLLELLYGARGSWRTVRLSLRDRSHDERVRAAVDRRVETLESQGRTSVRVSFSTPGSGEPRPETRGTRQESGPTATARGSNPSSGTVRS